MKKKFKAKRTLLTWDEIRAIEAKHPKDSDVRKLVSHMRLFEHLHGIVLDELYALKYKPKG
jgi:hypothetical protein